MAKKTKSGTTPTIPNTTSRNRNDDRSDINLIDLKGDVHPDLLPSQDEYGVEGVVDIDNDGNVNMDFSKLKFIEKPVEADNLRLPQTLKGCVGYMKKLPLRPPNADQSDPQTIVDMINSVMDMDKMFPDLHDDAVANLVHCGSTNNSVSGPNYTPKPTYHLRAPGVIGHTVRPGCISLYQRLGTVYAAPEGTWMLLNPLASWMGGYKNISLDKDLIRTDDNQVMVIRIIEGCVGRITVQGVHHLLDVGTHVFNTGTVQFCGAPQFASVNHISHGPYNYLNVPRGKNAKIWAEVRNSTDGTKALVPRLIKEGEHFIKSTFFKCVGMVKMSDEYIGHDSIHILNVVKGLIAKANVDNSPRLYGEGLHIIESPNFFYRGMEHITSDNLCISHGTITILQVPRGKIALLWNKNEPIFLDKPGLYEWNDNNVHFCEFVDASERFIELGSKKVIQVYTGEVGITYDEGQLKILKNGRHVIDSSTHFFERFLSTKQRSIRLITYNASHKIAKSQDNRTSKKASRDDQPKPTSSKWNFNMDEEADLLVCETKDLVKVGVRADVFYSIVDPDKCIQTLNTDELEDLVRETAVATLTNIIRSTALNQIAQSRQISASVSPDSTLATAENVTALDDNGFPIEGVSDADNGAAAAAVSYFFDRAHDEFMTKLHEDFVTRYGVDIANIRMESFKIMDTELASEISQNCLTTAHVENQLSNLQGQNLIATQKEQTAADCKKIKALAEAKALSVTADAENKRRIDAAKADAEAKKLQLITEAQALADSIVLKAEAEAQAIKMKAAAEAERAKLLSQTTLGQQQCLFEIYADMVKTSNEGVDKVVYLDPSVNKDSPFALGSLDGLNRDLQSMSKLGIASVSASASGELVAAGSSPSNTN
mmetsp:Transcript_22584/g.53390  ORF Transcript_22584/g.53390 Transcript_22584/m.53390 type:complete len:883 (+) Transcript_22584:475-3123(+)